MPRNVRNFWIEGRIDGHKSSIAGGPVSKDGGFELVIKQRDAGGIIVALEVRGYVKDGELCLWADCPLKNQRIDFRTVR